MPRRDLRSKSSNKAILKHFFLKRPPSIAAPSKIGAAQLKHWALDRNTRAG